MTKSLSPEKYEYYVDALKSELVPAMGCTEPIAIAYAAAKAREVLGAMPERVSHLVTLPINKEKAGT